MQAPEAFARQSQALVANLRGVAIAEGFDDIGIASPDGLGVAGARLGEFLRIGRHGSMDWMADSEARRADPRALWPEVRSVVMLAMSYGPASDPLAALGDTSRGAISCYAKGKDYHTVVKKALKRVAGWLVREAGGTVKVFCDTAPVMEKPLAAAAGLGWQGKHTNLVSRNLGSWFFLGAIFSDLTLPTTVGCEGDYGNSGGSEPHASAPSVSTQCGSCRKCLDICPTGAFPAPYQLDARRCISYLTIEHRGVIPIALRPAMGNRVFGCDDCLAVCPWNKFASVARETRFHPRFAVDNPPLSELLELTEDRFAERFAGTPVKRTGRDGMVRNALIAAANSGDVQYLSAVRRLLSDASPVVRATAVWALSQLAEPSKIAAEYRQRSSTETDFAVHSEWHDALNGCDRNKGSG